MKRVTPAIQEKLKLLNQIPEYINLQQETHAMKSY
jgi:hypothetical protein